MDSQPVPTYTRQRPHVPGFYWLREGDDEDIVEVWHDPNHQAGEAVLFVHRCGSGDFAEISSLPEVFWAGPLIKPAPPE